MLRKGSLFRSSRKKRKGKRRRNCMRMQYSYLILNTEHGWAAGIRKETVWCSVTEIRLCLMISPLHSADLIVFGPSRACTVNNGAGCIFTLIVFAASFAVLFVFSQRATGTRTDFMWFYVKHSLDEGIFSIYVLSSFFSKLYRHSEPSNAILKGFV